MATTSSNSWMPTQGRYSAKVGKSLTRVIKARKGEPPQKSKFPEQDFYSLRYNFIPPSVDSTKPGTIEVRKGQDTTSVTVERANSQTEEGGHIFVGTETTAKEVECVLIYDEVLGSFTLEKLDSYVNLTYDHKTTKPPRHASSPLPSSRPPTSTHSSSTLSSVQSQQKKRAQTAAEEFEAELERSLLGEDEDAPGGHEDGQLAPERRKKLVPPKKDVAPVKKEKALSFKKTRVPSPAQNPIKKEEEESEPETALAAAIAPKAPPKTQRKSLAAYVRAKNATPPPTSTPPAPPTHPLPPKPVVSLDPAQTKPLKTSPKKRELPSDIQSQPSSVTKKAKPSPPPKPTATPRLNPKKETPKKKEPVALALPGSEIVALPPAPLELPGPSQATSMVPDDSDNEEWDLVPETASAIPGKAKSPEPPMRTIEMIEIIPEPTTHVDPVGVSDTLAMEEEDEDEGDYEAVDIDENELQREMEREMEAHFEDEEEDGDPEVDVPPFPGPPMSLNNYVSQIGGMDDDDSDDDTTSDESE